VSDTVPAARVAWLPPELYPEHAPHGAYVEIDDDGSLGGLVVAVNENPHDAVDGTTSFVKYKGRKDRYHFRVRREGALTVDGKGNRSYIVDSEKLVADDGPLDVRQED
jgi:hypothetical protein